MKTILFLTLLLFISNQEISDTESTIKIFKCLLLDSNVVHDQVNSLVEALQTLDPLKLVSTFTTIYPAISAEVIRCTEKNELPELKEEEKVEEKKEVKKEEEKEEKEEKEEVKEEEPPSYNFIGTILKLIAQYLVPILKQFGINLSSVCKMIFPKLVYCDLIDFLA